MVCECEEELEGSTTRVLEMEAMEVNQGLNLRDLRRQ